MHMKMQRAMVDDYDEFSATLEAKDDWRNDVGDATGMDKEQFKRSIFQLADIWVEEIDAKEYPLNSYPTFAVPTLLT